jgi:hypothetical protein
VKGLDQKAQSIKDKLKARLNEAKVYDSMGLFEESRNVYASVLDEFPDLPHHARDRVRREITRLDAEIRGGKDDAPDAGVSPEAMSFLRDETSGGGDSGEVPARAAALCEAGRFAEALTEYAGMLKLEFPIDRVLGNLVSCILNVHGPDGALAEAENLADEASLGRRERAQLKFKLGVEMEEFGRLEDAISLYRSARMTISEDLNMRSALDAKIAGLSKGSPYAYLLNQGWVTEDDLLKARTRARQTGASVEAVLMDTCSIGKEELGRSLSLHYKVPFKTYDPNLMPPLKLLSRLDRAELTMEGWVPLGVYRREVNVLMETPDNTLKTGRIKALVNGLSLNTAVGIREDIEAYLERFYRVVEQASKSPAATVPHNPAAEVRSTRREPRYVPHIPDFSYVEFTLEAKGGEGKQYRLDVLNSSEHGIGILLRKNDMEIADIMPPGSVIKDMTFYSAWTLIRTSATVRHITKITSGPHAGDHILGVESRELVESSKVPG